MLRLDEFLWVFRAHILVFVVEALLVTPGILWGDWSDGGHHPGSPVLPAVTIIGGMIWGLLAVVSVCAWLAKFLVILEKLKKPEALG